MSTRTDSYKPLWLLAILILHSLTVRAVDFPGPLVSADWLAQYTGEVSVLDIRFDAESFTQRGHIPGAQLVELQQIQADRTENGQTLPRMVVDAATFQKLMREKGVSDHKPVVITYLKGETVLGTRLYWTLKYYGHQPLALLDGGTYAWGQAKHAFSNETSAVEPGNFIAGPGDASLLASKADVIQASQDQSSQILDARPAPFFLGSVQKPSVKKTGHIPGAELLPEAILVHPDSGQSYASKRELKQVLQAMDIDPDKPAISYCNSGLTASGSWFVLNELLGKQTKLYDGSMLEWAADDALKVEQ